MPRLIRRWQRALLLIQLFNFGGLRTIQFSDHSARVTGRQHACRYVDNHDAARPDHRVGADRHARTHNHSGRQPYVVAEHNRSCRLPAGSSGRVVVNGMQRRNKLWAWTDRHVIADRDRRAFQQDRVVVDEAACADGYLRTVVTLESGKDDRAFAQRSEQLVQHVLGPLVVRRTRIEHLEKTLTRLTAGHQFGIVCPVRFAAEHPLALTSHCPVTTQRPDSARQPTKIRRSAMNMLSPDQMPASPQSNTSDSQISGRKPASALTTVAVRMNAASPAPSSTPSSAKTTPAKGNWPTRNHHGIPIAASTDRSSRSRAQHHRRPAQRRPTPARR